MRWQKEFVELNKSIHERSSFDCGVVELNRFISTQAAKHRQAGISKTFVLPAVDSLPTGKWPICAFYTIAPSSICRSTLSVSLAKKLPHYPIPVFLLAQLAVAKDLQGNHLGKITLITALKCLIGIQAHMPAYAVVVDCINKKAEQFYEYYGFQVLCQCRERERTRMFLPMATVKQLFY